MYRVLPQADDVQHGTPAPRRLWACATLIFVLSVLVAPGRAGADDQSDATAAPLPDLASIERAFQQIVERVTPSVVGIRVQRRYMTTLPTPTGETKRAFEQLVTVNGSGTIIDRAGLILTNEHVVQAAHRIEVLLHDGESLPATIVSADARGDLAILKVDRDNLTPVQIVDWPDVARGQWAITLGNPYGLGRDGKLSVSIGVISNLERRLPGLGEVDDRFYADMIQTTADIHAGCSGGPLFNARGELVGVVTAMHTRAPADEGVGFAIPMSPQRLGVIQKLRDGEVVAYGYVGLEVRAAQPEERRAAGLDPRLGAVVQLVEPGGPASEAGLREGDLIFRFDGKEVRGPGTFAALVGQTSPGRRVPIELLRGDERMVIQADVLRRDVSRVSWMRGGAVLWRGARVAGLTTQVRRRMGVADESTGVVVIDVLEDSAAGRAGIQIGDVIEYVGATPVDDVVTFQAQVRRQQGPVKIRVRSRGELLVNG